MTKCWYPGCQSALLTNTVDGIRYCPSHPIDNWPEPDRALPGLCIFDGAIHERTWLIPSMKVRNGQSRACLRHYRRLVTGREQ